MIRTGGLKQCFLKCVTLPPWEALGRSNGAGRGKRRWPGRQRGGSLKQSFGTTVLQQSRYSQPTSSSQLFPNSYTIIAYFFFHMTSIFVLMIQTTWMNIYIKISCHFTPLKEKNIKKAPMFLITPGSGTQYLRDINIFHCGLEWLAFSPRVHSASRLLWWPTFSLWVELTSYSSLYLIYELEPTSWFLQQLTFSLWVDFVPVPRRIYLLT